MHTPLTHTHTCTHACTHTHIPVAGLYSTNIPVAGLVEPFGGGGARFRIVHGRPFQQFHHLLLFVTTSQLLGCVLIGGPRSQGGIHLEEDLGGRGRSSSNYAKPSVCATTLNIPLTWLPRQKSTFHGQAPTCMHMYYNMHVRITTCM